MTSLRTVSIGPSAHEVGEAINRGMQEILGSSGTLSTLYYTGFVQTDVTDFVMRFDELILALRKIFGPGSARIEKQIARSIFTNVTDRRAVRAFVHEYGSLTDSLLLAMHEFEHPG